MSIINHISNLDNLEKIYRKPHIPRNKASNAIKSYAQNLNYNDIEFLIDDTVFGSAKCGAIITATEFYGKELFVDSIFYSLPNIKSIYIKKNILTSILYINHKKVLTFTQPSAESLAVFFDQINSYYSQDFEQDSDVSSQKQAPNQRILHESTSNATDFPQKTASDLLENQSIDPNETEYIYQSPISLKDKNITTDRVGIKENPYEHTIKPDKTNNKDKLEITSSKLKSNVEEAQPNCAFSEYNSRIKKDVRVTSFRMLPNDEFISHVINRKKHNNISDLVGVFISSGHTTKSSEIRSVVSGYLGDSIIHLRRELIEKNHVEGLMNNVATMDLFAFAIANIINEFSMRRIDDTKVGDILLESLKEFHQADNSDESIIYFAKLLIIASELGDSYDKIISNFKVRLYASNLIGNAFYYKKDLADKLYSTPNFSEKNLEQAIAEVGDLKRYGISVMARRCVDKVIDLI